MQPISPAVLADLRRPRPYPAVSVLLPTHRKQPHSSQDSVRLRNALAAAKEAVENDPEVSRAYRFDVIGQLDAALAEVDLAYSLDGLAIFAAPGEYQVWALDRTVPERVVLAQTFLTRNLIAAQAADQPYWALVISADRGSLWSGGRDRVTEHTGDGFPLVRTLPDFDPERQERIGDRSSTFNDEEVRTFLRKLTDAVGAVLTAEPRPLYVVGEVEAVAALDDAGPLVKESVARVVHGGLVEGPAEALRQALQPATRAQAEAEVAEVLGDLDQARSRKTFGAGVDEVWQSVVEGRAALVVIEDDYRTTVRDDGEHLVPAGAGERGAREDIVDEIAEQALETGARVHFVPDGKLADMGRIAAVLRY
jgi:hypothetical protein